jgi:large subunit ribosomal protein L25
MPDYIDVDVSNLDLGKSIKVSEVQPGKYTIHNSPANPIASIETPRALRGKGAE